jgi:Lon protease-like protein
VDQVIVVGNADDRDGPSNRLVSGTESLESTTTTRTKTTMSQARAAAPRLFRTLRKLTKDLEQAVAGKPSFDLQKALRRQGNQEIENVASTVDLREYLKTTFRNNNQDHQTWKDRVTLAIHGVQKMELVIKEAHCHVEEDNERNVADQRASNKSDMDNNAIIHVHDGWVVSYINQVEWLPSLLDMSSSSSQLNVPSSSLDETSMIEELPMFPLTGPFMVPNQQPLELFTPYSYWNFPTPGAEIPLRIFEPRYRELYTDILVKGYYNNNTSTKQPRQQWFVVPFSHPIQPATYAQMGLLYEVTNWQEVADESKGVFQYVCQHEVRHPVRIHRVLNPDAWRTQDTYLRVQATIVRDSEEEEDDATSKDRASRELSEDDIERLERALEKKLEHSEHAAVCGALRAGGMWSFVRIWSKGLQQRVLQIELHWASSGPGEKSFFNSN